MCLSMGGARRLSQHTLARRARYMSRSAGQLKRRVGKKRLVERLGRSDQSGQLTGARGAFDFMRQFECVAGQRVFVRSFVVSALRLPYMTPGLFPAAFQQRTFGKPSFVDCFGLTAVSGSGARAHKLMQTLDCIRIVAGRCGRSPTACQPHCGIT